VKVLATSRARLRLRAERVYEVQVLPAEDALTLLLARTSALRGGRTQGGAEPELAEICRRLDRLPLALELAAPLLSIFGPAELLARLGQRLELLADGPLDVSERQQTLRNTIEWSYELLPSSARELLARSSVFVGGAPCDAIEAVCEATLEDLARLTEGSLGRVEEGRFLMLESIHSFAAERLQLAGRTEALRDRHARYFLEVARAADARLAVQDDDAFDVFQSDHDNLRAALGFFAAFDREALLDLAAHCGWFWFIRGHLSEGRRWLDAGLEAAEDAPVEFRSKALMRKGVIAELQDDLKAAEQAQS
jgi:predicted ATPase